MPTLLQGRGIGGIVSWFIRIVIYDICVTTIQEVLGVGRMTALFIFLGILLALSIGGWMLRRRMSRPADSDI
ncbi:MAG: hypothetical protein FJ293_14730 [Planctomycetes bacterium]|nr:hypothetical protein [Planctomycetota bacterium]